MTFEELQRKYHAPPLKFLGEGMMIININKTYRRAMGTNSIFEATRKHWAGVKRRISGLKYVLAEYSGCVVEVFEVDFWYQVEDFSGRNR